MTESYVAHALIRASILRQPFEKYIYTAEAIADMVQFEGIGKGAKTPFLFAYTPYLFRDTVTLVDLHEILDLNSLTCSQKLLYALLKQYPWSFKTFRQSLLYLISHKMILANSYKINEQLAVSANNTETTYTISNLGIELVNRIRQERYLTRHAVQV